MNLSEKARNIAGSIVAVKRENLGDAIKRSHADYERAHQSHDEMVIKTGFIARAEGELPQDLEQELDLSRANYRRRAELQATGRVPRKVEIVFLGRKHTFERVTQLKKMQRYSH